MPNGLFWPNAHIRFNIIIFDYFSSVVYWDQGEFEVALANIALAKEHNYPERLIPKLLAREVKCKEQIAVGQSKSTSPCPSLVMNVQVNPRIPFLSKDVYMKRLPNYGRSVIADRDFRAGEVILQEKPMLTALFPEVKYLNCDHCSISNFHTLIPCPNCVSVMYCSKECLEKGLRTSHRFECGISEKLQDLVYGRTNSGTRMFFYGLSLFEDNLNEMMAYCKSNEDTGDDPFALDYSKYDRLQEFKTFHNLKPRTCASESNYRFYAALYYSVYMQHPLVKSMFVTESQKNFMLQQFLRYIRNDYFLLTGGSNEIFTNQVYSFANICNHSCDPNAVASYGAGLLKLIVLQPIAKGEQICISYGAHYPQDNDVDRNNMLVRFSHFHCLCVACDKTQRKASWLARGSRLPPIPKTHIKAVTTALKDPTGTDATKLDAMQRFVQRHAAVHPRKAYDEVLRLYRIKLEEAVKNEAEALMRAKFAV